MDKQVKKSQGSLHAGHRRRMIERLLMGNLHEHEKLEVLLFYAIPRVNTNDIAHRLLARFGGLEKVFNASVEELKTVQGIGQRAAEYLFLIGEIYRGILPTKPVEYVGKGTPETFFPHVEAFYEDEKEEVLDVYLLNGEGNVFERKRLQGGGLGNVVFDPKDLAKVLLTKSPAGAILVHNHPFGESKPSDADVETTKRCQLICSSYNIILCDHVIYSPNGIYSFYHSKDLQGISLGFSLSTLSREGKDVKKGR